MGQRLGVAALWALVAYTMLFWYRHFSRQCDVCGNPVYLTRGYRYCPKCKTFYQ